MDAFFEWAARMQAGALPKGPLGEALTYAINQRARLELFLTDPRIPIHNNRSEDRLRIIALARHTYLFFWRPHLKKQPGMRSLQIEDRSRADGLPGKVVVSVQPSLKYTHGVFFDANNEVVTVDAKPGTSFFSEVIRDHLSRLLTEARSMAETVLREATQ